MHWGQEGCLWAQGTGKNIHRKNGYVGIGTNAPLAKLHIEDSVSLWGQLKVENPIKNGEAGISLKSNSNTGNRWLMAVNAFNMNNNSFVIGQSNPYGVRLTIEPNGGNVGVGTTKPKQKLHVFDDNGPVAIRVEGTSDGTNAGILEIADASSGDKWHIPIRTQRNQNLEFHVWDSNDSKWRGPHLVIQKDGNVGVGTMWPEWPLSVKRVPPSSTSQSYTGIALINEQPDGKEKTWTIYTGGPNGGWGIIPNGFDIWEYPETKSRFQIKASNGDTVLVPSGGNVGIGTTQPARKLHVNDVMRLQPRSSAPSSPQAGDMYIDSSDGNRLKVYDGSTWRACW
jgi:hypothetical protein